MRQVVRRAILAIFLGAIRFYRFFISPQLGAACRYEPTCSRYAEQAITERGILIGGLLTLWRIMRCHRFAAGGLDPVPRRKGRQP